VYFLCHLAVLLARMLIVPVVSDKRLEVSQVGLNETAEVIRQEESSRIFLPSRRLLSATSVGLLK
jgi:hypothetical protein